MNAVKRFLSIRVRCEFEVLFAKEFTLDIVNGAIEKISFGKFEDREIENLVILSRPCSLYFKQGECLIMVDKYNVQTVTGKRVERWLYENVGSAKVVRSKTDGRVYHIYSTACSAPPFTQRPKEDDNQDMLDEFEELDDRECDRIFAKIEISENQLGFRKGMGTREALFGLNVLMLRCLDVNQDIYVCFIDFEKAFDRVQHEKLIEILQRKNIDTRDIRLIANLYWGQTAKVRLDDCLSDNIEMRRGVQQGCILSPLLFNVYSETIFEEALAEGDEGIKINGQQFNNFRYADDTVVTTDSIEDLQYLLQRINDSCKRYGLNMNLKKIKYMVIAKQQNIDVKLTIDNTPIERVQHYKYLGTIINETAEQL